MDKTVEIGLEKIQRSALLLLFDHINDAIDAQETDWIARDVDFYGHLGRPAPDFSIEAIPPENFYPGHIPSLLDAADNGELDKYPNLSAIAYLARPQGWSDDNADAYAETLAIEIMTKSRKSEEEVNTRTQRTIEAAHSVLLSEEGRSLPTKYGDEYLVPRLSTPPVVTIGDVFIVGIGGDPTDRWFWQGGRLEYTVDKYIQYGQFGY